MTWVVQGPKLRPVCQEPQEIGAPECVWDRPLHANMQPVIRRILTRDSTVPNIGKHGVLVLAVAASIRRV